MTTPQQATPAASKRKLPPGALKAYVASLTGTSLEYYDFAIYSVASALVFPKVFFPGTTTSSGCCCPSPPLRSATSPGPSAA